MGRTDRRAVEAPGPPRELLSGAVERVTFHNPENGFAVLRVQARGQRDLVSVVGHIATISPGEYIQASGTWERDRTHGLQFRATYLHAAAPTTEDGIERYLASGLVRGIGPHFAKRLVAAFGTSVFDVIEQTPARLRDVAGIGPVRADRIADAWKSQRIVRDIMVFLHSNGVGTSRAVRIYKTYGADAIALIRENPYRLARDIRGIGFVTADRIATKLGIAHDAVLRVRAGVAYVLTQALDDGHCGLPRSDLIDLATRQLGVSTTNVDDALRLELAAGDLVADEVEGQPLLFLAGLHAAERGIAERLRGPAGRPPWPPIDPDRALPWVEAKLGIALAEGQREALRRALGTKVLVITGGPGVGKTTILNALLRIVTAKGARPLLAAPTGRAARRMSEATGLEARTIHRLLEVDPMSGRFRRKEDAPLDGDLVVIDETSMVDVPLMHALLRAVPPHASLVLVGDVDQLPSVGPGQVLGDIIASGVVPVVRLTEVFRQAAQSGIVRAAHRINAGAMPEWSPAGEGDFFFVDAAEPEDAQRRVLQLVQERIPRRFGLDAIRDIQVLCPMNRGGVGARALNAALQQALNRSDGPRVERFGWSFASGDKVMQQENDYEKEVYNGDLGIVLSISPDEQVVTVSFDGRPVEYGFGELDQLSLAYATTIHKAQGSEYPAVVVPLTTQHYTMLQRNLLYTAVTRGRKLVVLVGQRKALAIAVRAVEQRKRWTRLRTLLAQASRLLNSEF